MLLKKIVLGGAVLSVLLLCGCQTVPYDSSGRRESLNALCRQWNIELRYDPVVRSVQLIKNRQTIHLLVDSRTAVLGTREILLSSTVSARGDEIYVPPDFRERVLCRLDQQFCAGRTTPRAFRIVIDPGHGGKDPGAVGAYGLKEKDVVLDISRRLAKLLKQDGYDIRVTRNSDKFISLGLRTEYAADWNADLFISVHANASESRQAAGFEVWAPRILKYEDMSEPQRLKNHRIFFKHFNMKSGHRFLEKTLEDMLYRHKRAESLKLASRISQKCLRSISPRNRGVKESGFFVLRNTLVPSVLIEVGFITNRTEARRFQSPSHRQEVAGMLARGILEYMRER